MSWQLASFLILGGVLLGGFAWYERSRPPSQVVALVAALAALAIAGRIAFAAFPNVKPTTDIVVFAGYALGPAPGFAVGAFAGLVSNFWFGQGPWTPWQMVGWGLCGVLGAALALGARNASRLTLAAACGFAGIAYGVLQNFSLMAIYGGDLSMRHFLVLEARAVPFDAAHAIGNVAFALLAGPAMVRMLVRFRERFEWRTPAVATAVLLALLLPAVVPGPARAAAGAERAASWLESAQNSDGGFGASAGDPSGAAVTGWVMMGLEAAGRNPLDVERLGKTPVDFLRSSIGELTSSGDLARTIVALQGAGLDPRSFAGRDLVEELLKHRAENGSFAGWPGTTSYSLIALRTAGVGGLDKTASWLVAVENGDGGWGDVPGEPSNADVTAAVIQAIPGTKAAKAGLSYLGKHQRPDGGFTGGSGGVNSQSTGWAVQAMIAAGTDPATIASGGNSGPDYLGAQQAGDGHYRYSASSDQTPVWVTGEALVAAAGEALPISPPPREKQVTTVAPPTAVPAAPGVGEGSAAPAETPPEPRGGTGSSTGASPGATPFPPAATGGVSPAPGAGGSGGSPGSEAGIAPVAAAVPPSQPVAATGKAPSPGIPIAIGLACAALAIGIPWLLGRRYAW
ncbi:MAG TPA: prenyltransferase/squalene oxidase repeat-containing protein [Solirubrobacterales bacterium]|jgi:energy-coupling factor transport system substrate-specific component